MSKRMIAAYEVVKQDSLPTLEAIKLLQSTPSAKFDEALDIQITLDAPAKEKPINSSVALPHGIGRDVKIAIFSNAHQDINGADFITSVSEDFKSVISKYDRCGALPAGVPIAAKAAPVLGPMGMMPNAKNGTVMTDAEKLVQHLKNSVFFREKLGKIMTRVGSRSMKADQLDENIQAFIAAIPKERLKYCFISFTMSPGVKLILS